MMRQVLVLHDIVRFKIGDYLILIAIWTDRLQYSIRLFIYFVYTNIMRNFGKTLIS